MSMSMGHGGASVVGVVVGGTVTHSASAVPALRSLPFTGASHLMELVALALVLIVTGILAVGMARRRPDESDLP